MFGRRVYSGMEAIRKNAANESATDCIEQASSKQTYLSRLLAIFLLAFQGHQPAATRRSATQTDRIDCMPAHQVDDPELLLALLAQHSLACPVCGYDVRSLKRPVCPECGARLRLSLGSPDLRIHHLIAGLVGLAIGLGFTANVGLMLAVQIIRGAGSGPGITGAAVYAAATSAILLTLLIATARARHRFLSWRGQRQRIASLGLILLSIACAFGMIMFLVISVF